MKYCLSILYLCILIVSCNPSQNRVNTQSHPVISIEEVRKTDLMQEKGIDFFAEGSVPVNWNLQMNYDDTVRFIADDGISIRYAYNQLKKDNKAERSIFSARASGGEFTIVVTEKICTVPVQKEVFSKQVKVTFNTSSYSGCGKYLSNNLLNNKWLLEKIGNIMLKSEEYNRIPVIQFDLAKGTVTGNDGCNSISGKMEVQGNRIKFSKLLSTKMACSKKSENKIFSEQISNKLVDYYFKADKLYLYLPDDNLMVFKKSP